MSLKIAARVRIYETNGEDVPFAKKVEPLLVERHWNRHQDFIVLQIGEYNFTVATKDLLNAIKAVTIQ